MTGRIIKPAYFLLIYFCGAISRQYKCCFAIVGRPYTPEFALNSVGPVARYTDWYHQSFNKIQPNSGWGIILPIWLCHWHDVQTSSRCTKENGLTARVQLHFWSGPNYVPLCLPSTVTSDERLRVSTHGQLDCIYNIFQTNNYENIPSPHHWPHVRRVADRNIPIETEWRIYASAKRAIIVPPPNEVGGGGGYTGFTLSVRLSVCPFVRLSVDHMVSGA